MEAFKLITKLHKHRIAAKQIHKEQYSNRVYPFKKVITEAVRTTKKDPLQVLEEISKTKIYSENPMAQMMLICATLEIMEDDT